MSMLLSTILNLPVQAPRRGAHWRWRCACCAVAALQLSACGGEDAAAPLARGTEAGGMAPGIPVAQVAALSADMRCAGQVNDTPEQLLECVTLAGVRAHQSALADIAAAHWGTRLAGTRGYDASLDYARQVLTEAGYRVSVQPFEFPVFSVRASSVQEPGPYGLQALSHAVLDYSGSGDVTAAVSVARAPEGCAPPDFAAFPRGHIALVRRGGCALMDKVAHAVQAGAAGVVVYNNDASELSGTLTHEAPLDLPVVMVSLAQGEEWARRSATGLQLRLKTDTQRSLKTTYNLLAESVQGDPGYVVMVGAHLDSVRAGAGVNDNGSGVAAVLETARQMARVQPRNQLRFAFWGAEEQGLLGSTYYVRSLDRAQRARIGLYLNFDMIGSPNPVFSVYGGDVPGGQSPSGRIVDVLHGFYRQRGLASRSENAGSRSDHKPFADIGIPFGGLFTGAEEIKTAEEARIWGGRAGVPYDPCYHRRCDNLANVNDTTLEINADAVANATLFFAMHRAGE